MEVIECEEVVLKWKQWCGDTPWSDCLKRFGDLGGKIIWYCGYPRSVSAIPLCFTLILPNKQEINGSRLKDIKLAIRLVESPGKGGK